jgi:hypothetical protein
MGEMVIFRTDLGKFTSKKTTIDSFYHQTKNKGMQCKLKK